MNQKIILASGYANSALDGEKMGGLQFLPKPYRMADLVRKLRAVG